MSRRRAERGAVRRPSAGPRLGATPHADTRFVPDRRHDVSGGFRFRRAGAKCGNGDAERFWDQHRGSFEEKDITFGRRSNGASVLTFERRSRRDRMARITRRRFVKGAAIAPLAAKPFLLGQRAGPPDRFDIVVAGAGHNSLIAAAYLAKAGYRCLVLEGRPLLGGGVKTAELTPKGFKDDVCSTAHTFLQDNPMMRNDELQLRDFGLEYVDPDPIFHIPFPDGTYLTQWRDVDHTCAEFAKFSKKDAEAYQKMLAEFDAIKPILLGTSFAPIGFGKPLNEVLAGQPRGKLWQRRLAMSAWEIIRDTF